MGDSEVEGSGVSIKPRKLCHNRTDKRMKDILNVYFRTATTYFF